MRVAIVENTRITHHGQVGVALHERAALVDLWKPWADNGLPTTDAADALVVFGGEQSATDDHTHPYLPALADLMAAYTAADKPVLGICLGSQLLARAFGAENHLGTAPEFGWVDVSLTDTGRADPVLRHVVPAPDGTVLADRNGAGTDPRTYGTNAHHDVTWVADASGAVTATARFDPWGTLLRSSGTLPAWRFQGSWYDPVTDLAYARARWYSSPLGFFISEDTLLGSPETPASTWSASPARPPRVAG